MSDFQYTYRERQKNWTVQDAINAARAILIEKNISHMCTDAVSRMEPKEQINMIELNRISKELVEDSIYYNY